MKRISTILAGALACLALAAVGTAAAMPTEESVNATCSVTSKKIASGKAYARVIGENVDPSQRKYAECNVVERVVRAVINRGVEEPTVVKGFRITPSVVTTNPESVKYKGLFRGADTATEITLKFRITYADN